MLHCLPTGKVAYFARCLPVSSLEVAFVKTEKNIINEMTSCAATFETSWPPAAPPPLPSAFEPSLDCVPRKATVVPSIISEYWLEVPRASLVEMPCDLVCAPPIFLLGFVDIPPQLVDLPGRPCMRLNTNPSLRSLLDSYRLSQFGIFVCHLCLDLQCLECCSVLRVLDPV